VDWWQHKTDMRNLAVGLGGNAIFVTSEQGRTVLTGVAYRCPQWSFCCATRLARPPVNFDAGPPPKTSGTSAAPGRCAYWLRAGPRLRARRVAGALRASCERERQAKRIVHGYSAQGDNLEPVPRFAPVGEPNPMSAIDPKRTLAQL